MKKHRVEFSDCNDRTCSSWSLINGQGSKLAKAEVKTTEGHEETLKTKDCVWLLSAYETATTKAHHSKNFTFTIVVARKDFCNHIQQTRQTLINCAENLESICKSIKEINPKISAGLYSTLAKVVKEMHEDEAGLTPKYDSLAEFEACQKWTDQQMLAMLFINNADNYQHGEVKE